MLRYVINKLHSCWQQLITSREESSITELKWVSVQVGHSEQRGQVSLCVHTVCMLCTRWQYVSADRERKGWATQVGLESFITSSVLWNNPLQQQKVRGLLPDLMCDVDTDTHSVYCYFSTTGFCQLSLHAHKCFMQMHRVNYRRWQMHYSSVWREGVCAPGVTV